MRKMTVLFADDDSSFRDYMTEAIGEISNEIEVEFDVTEATDGSIAIDLYDDAIEKDKPFDFVITDHKMPKKSGLHLVKHIIKTKPVPIIVLSGYSEPEPNEFIKNGAILFISKPFRFEQISAAFSEAVSLSLTDEDIKKAEEVIEKLEKLTS